MNHRHASDLSNHKILIITGLALVIRLLYLFFVVPVDWIGDSYHHWQVAWFTLKIGLSHGRMWDLKGVEYYWPPLPTLVESFLMGLLGNSSLIIMRLFNSAIGALSVAVVYLIGRRNSEEVGLTVASALIFFPLTLNYEVLGLHEPLMGFFAMLGVLMFLRKRNFLSGMLFGLSYLCHFTVYLTVPFILLFMIIQKKSLEGLIPFGVGFSLAYIPYAFMLRSHTGDPLYNIRWLITFAGTSIAKMENPLSIVIGPTLLTIGSASLLLLSRITSPDTALIAYLYGIYSVFWGFIIIFIGSPLSQYELRYYWILIMLSLLILSIMINKSESLRTKISVNLEIPRSSLIVGTLSAMSLILLIPTFAQLQSPIAFDFLAADKLGEYYEEGTIISPVPDMTYRLTNKWMIHPKHILGPIYCPVEASNKMRWLETHNVTLLFWLPDFEADRVFPELSKGENNPPFYLLEDLSYDRYIYKVDLRARTQQPTDIQ